MDFGLCGRAKDHADDDDDDDGMNAVNVGHFFKVNYKTEFDSSRRRMLAQGEREEARDIESDEGERKSDDDVLDGIHFFDKTILQGHTHTREWITWKRWKKSSLKAKQYSIIKSKSWNWP